MRPHRYWQDRIAELDPDVDYAEIYKILSVYEFPWDIFQALSFALFRTYAVPSIGGLLAETGELIERTQKRYDDTVLLLDALLEHGPDNATGRPALRRINQMHGPYPISNDDFRYVLSTFVVVPERWVASYGARPLTDHERRATVNYYREVAKFMNIANPPTTFAEYEKFLDEYEATHFAYNDASRAVAEATVDLFVGFYPRALARIVRQFTIAIMDEPLRRAFGFEAPPPWFVRAAQLALRARGAFTGLLPARSKPCWARNRRTIRSYPQGYDVSKLGTHAPHHRTRSEPA